MSSCLDVWKETQAGSVAALTGTVKKVNGRPDNLPVAAAESFTAEVL
jgi:hypothetical protein